MIIRLPRNKLLSFSLWFIVSLLFLFYTQQTAHAQALYQCSIQSDGSGCWKLVNYTEYYVECDDYYDSDICWVQCTQTEPGCESAPGGIPPPPPPSTSCGTPHFLYSECDWNAHQVRDVYQDNCGNYSYQNQHTEPGICGAPPTSSGPPPPPPSGGGQVYYLCDPNYRSCSSTTVPTAGSYGSLDQCQNVCNPPVVTPEEPQAPEVPVTPTPPTAYFTSNPGSGNVGGILYYSATASGTNLSQLDILIADATSPLNLASSWTVLGSSGCSGNTCSVEANWVPDQSTSNHNFIIVINAFDDNGLQCSGNPASNPTIWASCNAGGGEDASYTYINIYNPPAPVEPEPVTPTEPTEPVVPVQPPVTVPPTATISGPNSATVGDQVNFYASATGSGLSQIGIYSVNQSDPSSLIELGSADCSGQTSCNLNFPWVPDQNDANQSFYVFVNAYDENGTACSGNPSRDPSAWSECASGNSDLVTINVLPLPLQPETPPIAPEQPPSVPQEPVQNPTQNPPACDLAILYGACVGQTANGAIFGDQVCINTQNGPEIQCILTTCENGASPPDCTPPPVQPTDQSPGTTQNPICELGEEIDSCQQGLAIGTNTCVTDPSGLPKIQCIINGCSNGGNLPDCQPITAPQTPVQPQVTQPAQAEPEPVNQTQPQVSIRPQILSKRAFVDGQPENIENQEISNDSNVTLEVTVPAEMGNDFACRWNYGDGRGDITDDCVSEEGVYPPGSHTVTVYVVNSAGEESERESFNFRVRFPPQVNAINTFINGQRVDLANRNNIAPLTVTFTAAIPPEVGGFSCKWDFGDSQSNASAPNCQIAKTFQAGARSVSLYIVNDLNQESERKTVSFSVNPAPAPAPASVTPQVTTVTESFNCYARIDCAKDRDNRLTGYATKTWFEGQTSSTGDCPVQERVYAPLDCPVAENLEEAKFTGEKLTLERNKEILQTPLSEIVTRPQQPEQSTPVCTLVPKSVEYDCSNSQRCFNDFDVDTSKCEFIQRTNADGNHFHCDVDPACKLVSGEVYTEPSVGDRIGGFFKDNVLNPEVNPLAAQVQFVSDRIGDITTLWGNAEEAVVNFAESVQLPVAVYFDDSGLIHLKADFGFAKDIANRAGDVASLITNNIKDSSYSERVERETADALWKINAAMEVDQQKGTAGALNPAQLIYGDRETIDRAKSKFFAGGKTRDALKDALLQMNIDIDVGAEEKIIGTCPNIIGGDLFGPNLNLCLTKSTLVPTDISSGYSAVLRQGITMQLAADNGLDINHPEDWPEEKARFFFEALPQRTPNLAKAIVESGLSPFGPKHFGVPFIPLTAQEDAEDAHNLCTNDYGNLCDLRPYDAGAFAKLTDSELQAVNANIRSLNIRDSSFQPADINLVRQFAVTNYSTAVRGVDSVAEQAARQRTAQELGITPEELDQIEDTYKAYVSVGDAVRDTPVGRLWVEKANTRNIEAVIAATTWVAGPIVLQTGFEVTRAVIGKVITAGAKDAIGNEAERVIIEQFNKSNVEDKTILETWSRLLGNDADDFVAKVEGRVQNYKGNSRLQRMGFTEDQLWEHSIGDEIAVLGLAEQEQARLLFGGNNASSVESFRRYRELVQDIQNQASRAEVEPVQEAVRTVAPKILGDLENGNFAAEAVGDVSRPVVVLSEEGAKFVSPGGGTLILGGSGEEVRTLTRGIEETWDDFLDRVIPGRVKPAEIPAGFTTGDDVVSALDNLAARINGEALSPSEHNANTLKNLLATVDAGEHEMILGSDGKLYLLEDKNAPKEGLTVLARVEENTRGELEIKGIDIPIGTRESVERDIESVLAVISKEKEIPEIPISKKPQEDIIAAIEAQKDVVILSPAPEIKEQVLTGVNPKNYQPSDIAERLGLGEQVGRGGVGVIYDSGEDTVVKIFEPSIGPINTGFNATQVEGLKLWTEQFPDSTLFPKLRQVFYGETENGEKFLIGFEMDKVEGQTLKDFIEAGGKLDKEAVDRALAEYKRITEESGILFGDLNNRRNIMVKPDGELVFVDPSGYKPPVPLGGPKTVEDEQFTLEQILRSAQKEEPVTAPKIEPNGQRLPIISSEPTSGKMVIAQDGSFPFKFEATEGKLVTTSDGETYVIGDKFIVNEGRQIVPVRLSDGTIAMVDLSTSEHNFQWFVGVAPPDGPRGFYWYPKSNRGKKIMGVDLELDAAIKRAVTNGELTELPVPQDDLGFYHFLEQFGLTRPEDTYERARRKPETTADKLVNSLGVSHEEIPTEAVKRMFRAIGQSKPESIVYSRFSNTLDVYFRVDSELGPHTIIYTFDLAPNNLTASRLAVDFNLRSTSNPKIRYKPIYETHDSKVGVPAVVRTIQGIKDDPGWLELSQMGRNLPIGQQISQMTNGFTRPVSPNDLNRFLSEYNLVPELAAKGANPIVTTVTAVADNIVANAEFVFNNFKGFFNPEPKTTVRIQNRVLRSAQDARSYEELNIFLRSKGLIQGSRQVPYSAGELEGLIADVRAGRKPTTVLTSSEGVRNKVIELMNKEGIPCPVGFNLIPTVYAQGVNPCPNPGIFERVRSWFDGIFRREKDVPSVNKPLVDETSKTIIADAPAISLMQISEWEELSKLKIGQETKYGRVIASDEGVTAIADQQNGVITKIYGDITSPYAFESNGSEVAILEKFGGQNSLPRLYEVKRGTEGALLGYEAELINGPTLYDFATAQSGRITIDEASEFLDDLIALHTKTGVPHNDLNYNNVLIEAVTRSDGSIGHRLRIIDYGAKNMDEVRLYPNELQDSFDRDFSNAMSLVAQRISRERPVPLIDASESEFRTFVKKYNSDLDPEALDSYVNKLTNGLFWTRRLPPETGGTDIRPGFGLNPCPVGFNLIPVVYAAEPCLLSVISGDSSKGKFYIPNDKTLPFAFDDIQERTADFGGHKLTIADSYFTDFNGRIYVPIRFDDGTVAMVYLSTSEGDFKWFIGEDVNGFIIKSVKGKEIMDVPFELNRKLKQALRDDELAQYSDQSFLRALYDYKLMRDESEQRGLHDGLPTTMDKFLESIGAREKEISVEDAKKIALSIDYSNPYAIFYDDKTQKIDVYFRGSSSEFGPHEARFTFDLSRKENGEVINLEPGENYHYLDPKNPDSEIDFDANLKIPVDFTIRPLDDSRVSFTPSYQFTYLNNEIYTGKGVPSIARIDGGLWVDQGWKEITEFGKNSRIGQRIRQLTDDLKAEPNPIEIDKLIDEFESPAAKVIDPCPVGFNIIPVVYAVAVPCPEPNIVQKVRDSIVDGYYTVKWGMSDISEKVGGRLEEDVTGFLGERFGKKDAAISAVETGFNHIDRVPEARDAFVKNMLPLFKPEERDEALASFERWFTGNYNPDTGKITLYRFVDFTPDYTLDSVIKDGIQPRGVRVNGSIEGALDVLGNSETKIDRDLAKAFRKQQQGQDVSKFIQEYGEASVGLSENDIATYWTTELNSSFADPKRYPTHKYRIAIELDPSEAWRVKTAQGAINDPSKTANRFKEWVRLHNRPIEDSLESWKGGEFEWTILGDIPPDRIKDITYLPTGEQVFTRLETGGSDIRPGFGLNPCPVGLNIIKPAYAATTVPCPEPNIFQKVFNSISDFFKNIFQKEKPVVNTDITELQGRVIIDYNYETPAQLAQRLGYGRKIGSGSFGEVYDTGNGIVAKLFVREPEDKEFNENEVRTIKLFTNKYPDLTIFPEFIKDIYGRLPNGDVELLGYERKLVEGKTLEQFSKEGGVLDPAKVEDALRQHKFVTDKENFVLGDITGPPGEILPSYFNPDNIMVEPDVSVVLIDFLPAEPGPKAPIFKSVEDEQLGLKQALEFYTHSPAERVKILGVVRSKDPNFNVYDFP